jgi:glyceraldehyde-3-phosphate dehydrogenase/erythrose-4-phosphate dehydrogenase
VDLKRHALAPIVALARLYALMAGSLAKGTVERLKAAAEGPLKGVLGFSDEPLVSIDYNHCPNSSTIDSLETAVIDGKLVRVLSWYDNEWGFSNRMVDTAGAMGKLL